MGSNRSIIFPTASFSPIIFLCLASAITVSGAMFTPVRPGQLYNITGIEIESATLVK
jgi:hypothetical protein